jgi:DNA mismatch repair protein MutL
VRFADPGAIHHSITDALENFRRRTFSYQGSGLADGSPQNNDKNTANNQELFTNDMQRPLAKNQTAYELATAALGENEPRYNPGSYRPADQPCGQLSNQLSAQPSKHGPLSRNGVRLLGRIFDLFILVEYKDRPFIIDQHAAHERILYNRFITGSIPQQELLVAIPFTTENEADDRFLKTQKKDLTNLGIVIEEEDGEWRIEALPADWRLPDSETIREILNLRTAGKNMAEHWAASLSCKKAVKDGDYLDDESALDLAEETLHLPDPHCPHGRPIWLEIRREDILRAVKRV